MTEPRQYPQDWRKKPRIPGFGIEINVRRVMDDNGERRRSAKPVKQLEVTLAPYSGHCTLPDIESLKSMNERGTSRTRTPRSRAGLSIADCTKLCKVIRRFARQGLDR